MTREKVGIEKYDEVYNRIHCDSSIAYELAEYFTFSVPGAQFTPQYKMKVWDGKIRLFNPATRLLYGGLFTYVRKFCKEREYDVEYITDFSAEEFSEEEAKQFVEDLKPKFLPRDYQLEAFIYGVRYRRGVLVSPTASGKSFIIYLLTRWFSKKTLIIVPTTSLVHQMYSDFEDYGFNSEKFCHKIYSGQEKMDIQKPVTITTWQSIYKMPKKWFEQFEVCIGDEAHLFKAKSLTSIMTKLINCKYRYGFTGTLDGTQTHKLVLEGLFGAVRQVTTTAELIEKKQLSDFYIKAIVLSYPDEVRQMIKGQDYHDEVDYIVRNNARNNFIKNLALSTKGNTLVLFQFVEKHGKELLKIIEDSNKQVAYVTGEVDGLAREEIRKLAEQHDDMIILASYGTFSTGVNVKNIHNIIFASPSKSRVRNLQSIGRGLRLNDNKERCILYDIADDLTWKSKKNHTILHFAERIKIYNEEKFDYKIYTVKLKV